MFGNDVTLNDRQLRAPSRLTQDEQDDKLRYESNKGVTDLSDEDLEFQATYESTQQSNNMMYSGKPIPQPKGTIQLDEGAMPSDMVMDNKGTTVPNFIQEIHGTSALEVDEEDEKMMKDFDSLRASGKYKSTEEVLDKMETSLGWNKNRMDQLLTNTDNGKSPYYERYNGDILLDSVQDSTIKLWLGGKELVTNLDPIDKEVQTRMQNETKINRDVGNALVYAAEAIPEIAVGLPVWQSLKIPGKMGIIGASIANGVFQGGLTAAAVKGETNNSGEAAAWGAAVGVISGAVTMIPLAGEVVKANTKAFIDSLGIDKQQLKEMVVALDVVEDLKNLDPFQKEIIAVAKMHPEAAVDLQRVVTGNQEVRRNFVDTMVKKEQSAKLGIVGKPKQNWHEVYEEAIHQPQQFYVKAQREIKENLSKATIKADELGLDANMLKFNDTLLEKWAPQNVATLEKLREGGDVTVEELTAIRREFSSQSARLTEEGASELGTVFKDLAKIIDSEAMPKILANNALPENAITIANTYDKAVSGYAAMNNLLRNMMGSKVFNSTTTKALQQAVREGFKTTDIATLKSQGTDFISQLQKVAPKQVPYVESLMVREIVNSRKVPVSGTNKLEMIDWTQVARDLDEIGSQAFVSQEGKAAYTMMKKIADVSQTDLAMTRSIFGSVEPSTMANMSRSALGFGHKLIAAKYALSKFLRYANNSSAFTVSLEKALKMKGSNLSETLMSMHNLGIVQSAGNKSVMDSFRTALRETAALQEEMNKEHNFKYLENTDLPKEVNGEYFSTLGDMVAKGELKINMGDVIPLDSMGKTALVVGENVKIGNIPKIARLKDKEFITLPEVLDAPELYKKYPFLKGTKIRPYRTTEGKHMPPESRGAANLNMNEVYVNMNPNTDTRGLVGTILHEVGHHIDSAVGVPQPMGRKTIENIVKTHYDGDYTAYANAHQVPDGVGVGVHDLYQTQIGEQTVRSGANQMVNGNEPTMNFGFLKSSESMRDEAQYLKMNGLIDDAAVVEKEIEPATKIEVTQKMTRLMGELPKNRKMKPSQLIGWLEKQGVSSQEIELSGLNSMKENNKDMPNTIEGFEWMMKNVFDDMHKVSFDVRTQADNTYLYQGISYKGQGVDDDMFRVNSQAMHLPKRFRDSDMGQPTTHGIGVHPEEGMVELGHSRMGIQDIGGERTTVIHEIQSDWQQNSRQKGIPFARELDEFERLQEWKMKNPNELNPEYQKVQQRMEEIQGKYPHENLLDYLEKNDDIPYNYGNLFDWYDMPDGSVRHDPTGAVWEKSADGTEWINTTAAEGEKQANNIPIQRKGIGIADHPMSAKKYVQSQVVEGINFAIAEGTNRVVIPIERHYDDLKGTKGVTKAYENMIKPIGDLVDKLRKQGMQLSFKKIVDKGIDTPEGFVNEVQNIGEKLNEDITEIGYSTGIDPESLDSMRDIVMMETANVKNAKEMEQAMENIRTKGEKYFVDNLGYTKLEAQEQFDYLLEEHNIPQIISGAMERNLYEIRIKGKEKGSTQRWDFMSLIGAAGLGSMYNQGDKNEQ